jgi:hypothetical protein
MGILGDLNRDSIRREPLVWFRRVVLFDSIEPIQEIRRIDLRAGVNIIWGIEGEHGDNGFEPGHGVGKTTLCRLLRYCLGESTFGQSHALKEIRHSVSEGYVAAEIRVGGQSWAVLRPIGRHTASYAKVDGTIEQVIEEKPANSFRTFLTHLAATCLTGLRTDAVLSSGGSILWDHLLAMCARDQEARYDRFWNWRAPRSDSGTPRFKQPKLDASLCVRSVLQLLPDEETTLRRRIQTAAAELARLDEAIDERKREPAFLVRQHRRTLQDNFGLDGAFEASLDTDDAFGIPQRIERRIGELETVRNEATASLETLDRRISLAAASLLEPAELRGEEAAAAETTDIGTSTILRDIQELEDLRRTISEAAAAMCRYGRVLIGDCSYAQEQISQTDVQLREARSTELPDVARREQISAALAERTRRRDEVVGRLRAELDRLRRERNGLEDSRRNSIQQINGLRATLRQLQHWDAIHSGGEPDSELGGLARGRETADKEHRETTKSLAELLTAQNVRAADLRQKYDALVQATLSTDFKGRIELSAEGLEFQVYRGESLSGEAYDTLSILLADFTLLLMGALGLSKHPGLLIHDSPREADLGAQIYNRLLSNAAAVASEVGHDGNIPFQYIVTTTTPPPTALQKPATTPLRLGGTDGQLFKRQLHPPPSEGSQTLFPDAPHLEDRPGSAEQTNE